MSGALPPQAQCGDRIRFTPAQPSALEPVVEGRVFCILSTAPRPGNRYHLWLDRRCMDGAPAEARVYDNTGGHIEVLCPVSEVGA